MAAQFKSTRKDPLPTKGRPITTRMISKLQKWPHSYKNGRPIHTPQDHSKTTKMAIHTTKMADPFTLPGMTFWLQK
jgi:hypothetical protein